MTMASGTKKSHMHIKHQICSEFSSFLLWTNTLLDAVYVFCLQLPSNFTLHYALKICYVFGMRKYTEDLSVAVFHAANSADAFE